MNDKDLYWLAGYLEGEGCFTIDKISGRIYPKISLQTTDFDVIERARKLLDSKGPWNRKSNTKICTKPKPSWAINITGKKAVKYMKILLPLMGKRRQNRIREILELYKKQIPPKLNQLKTHCKYGHEFNEENTYYYPNGHRMCRICHKEYMREWNKKLL